jgi:ribulose-phosphate 3-epimerase
MNNIEIIPAVLTDTLEGIEKHLSEVSSLTEWVQIDVVDGIYAPRKTWPYINDEKDLFSKIIRQEISFPHIEDINFEIDLMVADPIFDADRWIAVGARRLVIHMRSISKDNIKTLAQNIKDKGVGLVLGFSITDSIEILTSYIETIQSIYPEKNMIDGIQCMGIDHEGYQHEDFDEKVLDHISNIKKIYPSINISVDGSVNKMTAKKIVDAGATRLIVGSAIFNGQVEKNIKEMREIVG